MGLPLPEVMVPHRNVLVPGAVQLRDQVQPERHLVTPVVTTHLWFGCWGNESEREKRSIVENYARQESALKRLCRVGLGRRTNGATSWKKSKRMVALNALTNHRRWEESSSLSLSFRCRMVQMYIRREL